jgi:lipoyl(octanoyl) transferase
MLNVRQLGRADYQTTWDAMRQFTDSRTADTVDELWLLEHPPVFTQGQAGKAEHLLSPGNIPVVQADRGGQVTYHGPGQLVGYCLFDLRRLGLGPRALVEGVEDALVSVLQQLDIPAAANRDAHGVYIDGKKIASIGLRIRKGCSYHGFALNVDMDTEPFHRINPCGYSGLEMTQVRDFLGERTPRLTVLGEQLAVALQQRFSVPT